MKRRRFFVAGVVGMLVILAAVAAVSADIHISGVLRSWDDAAARYENGNLTMFLNNQLQPFWDVVEFDNDVQPNACGTGNTTVSGSVQIGLYNTDNNPAGAPGFQSTKDWALVKCSTFDTNKYPAPEDIIATCVPAATPGINACEVVTQDVPTACGTGNCQTEIVTTFDLVLDQNCDGTIDPQFAPTGGLCFYWGAVKPPLDVTPRWGGNIQVRISSLGDGDKTINFGDLRGPTALTLGSLSASSHGVPAGSVAVAGGVVLGLFGIVWAWRRARG